MNTHLRLLLCLVLLPASSDLLVAQWSGNPAINNAICTAVRNQRFPSIISDGKGGAVIVWEDERPMTSTFDIYAQRVNIDGVMQWAQDGNPVCISVGNQQRPVMATDGRGGIIVAFSDTRYANANVFAQHVDSSGQIRWTGDGVDLIGPISQAKEQSEQTICSDGSGGAIVMWSDRTFGGSDGVIFCQHLDAAGNKLWGDEGLIVVPYDNTTGYYHTGPNCVSDGRGGAIVGWELFTGGASGIDLLALRVTGGGTAGWQYISVLSADVGNEAFLAMSEDGVGGALFAYVNNSSSTPRVYVNRLNASGEKKWPGPVSTAGGKQEYPHIAGVGAGAGVVAWEDYRAGGSSDIYAQRYDSMGTAQWGANGKLICNASNSQFTPHVESDGTGGAVILWEDRRNGNLNGDLYAQRVNAQGTIMWQANGVAVSTAPNTQTMPKGVSDGSAGIIATWEDYRVSFSNSGIFAFRILADGTFPHGAPYLDLATKNMNFGVVAVGRDKDMSFPLENIGDDTIRVASITSSNPAFVPRPTTMKVGTGQTLRDTVRFTPTATGSSSGVIVITSNSSTSPDTVTVSGNGTGAPIFSCETESISFGRVKLGLQRDSLITITNNGMDTLKIASVQSSNSAFTVTTAIRNLMPGASFVDTVRFRPKAVGAVNARLLFTSNAFTSPDTLRVTGIGYDAVNILVSPDRISFPKTPVGRSRDTLCAIKNNGGDTLIVTAFDSDAMAFSAQPAVFKVNPGATFNTTIRFTPNITGNLSGQLTMYSNSVSNPDVVIVSGTGDADVVFSPTAIDFGTVATVAFRDTLVMIQNLKPDTLVVADITSDNPAFSMRPSQLRVAPGSTFADTLRFAPTSIGAVSGTVSIISNSASSPDHISVTGEGKFVVGIDPMPAAGKDILLARNFPNPFSRSTAISYALAVPGYLTVTVVNSLGQTVAVLHDAEQQPGTYRVTWQPGNAPSGLYRAMLSVAGRTVVQPMLLVR